MPTVLFPRLLDPATGGKRSVEVGGDTVETVLTNLVAEMPSLQVHLFDHTGELRPHVLCFIDGQSTRLDDREKALSPGAQLRFLQAVSGG